MKTWIVAFLWTLLATPALAADSAPRKIAVFHMVARVGLDPGAAEVFAAVLQTELRTRKHEVIGRGDLEAVLGWERVKDVIGCEKTSCLVELGGSLGVDEIVTGDLARIGKNLIVSLRRLNATTGKVLKDSVRRVDGAPDKELLELIPFLVDDLYGLVAKPPVQESNGNWQAPPEHKEVIVSFESTPPGAVVIVDDKMLCQKTPCSHRLGVGPHVAAMLLERYEDMRQSLIVPSHDQKVHWTLVDRFGWLLVKAIGDAEPLLLNNTTQIQTGKKVELAPGSYEVTLRSLCHVEGTKQIMIRKGQETTLDWTFNPRSAGLKLRVKDDAGNDLRAHVRVDGKDYGDALATVTLPVCSKAIEVSADGHLPWVRPLSLQLENVTQLEVMLPLQRHVSTPHAEVQSDPVYRKPWFWVVVVGAGVAVTTGVLFGVALSSPTANRFGVVTF